MPVASTRTRELKRSVAYLSPMVEWRNTMTSPLSLPAVAVASLLAMIAISVGQPRAQQPSTQTSPLATEPLPAQGAGQVAPGAAVTGSSPGPGPIGTKTDGPPAPARTDNSQAQQGVLLKPGEKVSDMDAAAGAHPKPAESPK